MQARFMRHVNRSLFVILFILFAATVAACIYFSRAMVTLNHQIQETGESVQATVSLQALLRNLQQAESGQRGYIITGDDAYLQPYHAAVDRLPAVIALIDGQPSLDKQRPQIIMIKSLVNRKLQELDSVIALRKNGGFEAAQQATASNDGEDLMEQIRTPLLAMVRDRYRSIEPGQTRAKSVVRTSAIISTVLVFFVLAMCGIILRNVRQILVRERAIEGAKNEFLSLASHQLRTPATSVKQYLGMINAGYFGDLNEDQKEAVSTAYKSNETGINIINNLLNAAKLSLGKIELALKPVVIGDVINEVMDEYRASITAKDQTISFKNGLRGRKARLDAAYFKSVIENLVDNASKYSPDGATIRIKLTPSKLPKTFDLTVSDTGIGISKNDISKLFMKFSRLDNDYSETSEGSGLGLYWVKQVVGLHGGTVSVSSRPGKGTRFTVSLPLMR